jgi:hypothetical protein
MLFLILVCMVTWESRGQQQRLGQPANTGHKMGPGLGTALGRSNHRNYSGVETHRNQLGPLTSYITK